MRRLILFRHAKSAWGDPELPDHDRPLNERGRLAATLMGAFLVEQDLIPDLVLVSSSARTNETWERARHQFPTPPHAQENADLYHADPQEMLEIARQLPETAKTAMLIAHNPGLASFARKLTKGEASASRARAFTKFPTAGIAVFEAEIGDWRDLDFGTCAFTRFAMPKELV